MDNDISCTLYHVFVLHMFRGVLRAMKNFVPQCHGATEANELLNSLGAINYVGKRDLSDRRQRDFLLRKQKEFSELTRGRFFSRKYCRERKKKTDDKNFAEEQ